MALADMIAKRPRGRPKGKGNKITRRFKNWFVESTFDNPVFLAQAKHQLETGRNVPLLMFGLQHVVGKPQDPESGRAAQNHGFTLVVTGGASVTQLASSGSGRTLLLGQRAAQPPEQSTAPALPGPPEILPAQPAPESQKPGKPLARARRRLTRRPRLAQVERNRVSE